jgi:hypothetical protein
VCFRPWKQIKWINHTRMLPALQHLGCSPAPMLHLGKHLAHALLVRIDQLLDPGHVVDHHRQVGHRLQHTLLHFQVVARLQRETAISSVVVCWALGVWCSSSGINSERGQMTNHTHTKRTNTQSTKHTKHTYTQSTHSQTQTHAHRRGSLVDVHFTLCGTCLE